MSDEPASLNPRAISPELPAQAQPAAAPAAPAAAPVAGGEPDLVGQNLDGRYQVLRRLGEGELSQVYEARHTGSGRHFAIKVLNAALAAKPSTLDSFLQQARAAAQIRHDNVVTIEEFGYTPTQSVYASLELVVGDTLQTILDRDGRWSWAQGRSVALQIVAGLGAAHQAGVMHRALKPSNCFVILDPRGKRDPFVKVADFGMAQVGVDASQADPGATVTTIFGDPEYMAPEQGLGGTVSPQSDIYALGVLLYRLLTGQVPFSNPNAFQVISQHANKPVPPPRSIAPEIPEAIEQIVMRCLGKTPDQRYGSVAEIHQALEAVPPRARGGAQPGHPTAAVAPGGSGPRFARMNAGGAPSDDPNAPPPRQPSIIVAGAIGDGGGGLSGTIGGSAPASPSPLDSAPPSSEMTSSFLASRPGLRMGLGAALPGVGDGAPAGAGDEPAPPPAVAPGMAVPTPTMFLSRKDIPAGLSDAGPGMPPPIGEAPGVSKSDPSLPPPIGGGYQPASPSNLPAGGGYAPPSGPPSGLGPGMPSASGYAPPSGPGPGMPPSDGYAPPSGPGPGMPPSDGYTPPSGPGPGMPPSDGYAPPSGPGPGMPPSDGYAPPSGPGPGMPAGNGYAPPSGPGPGMPSAGGYTPPSGPGPGMPSAGGYTPPSGPGPGMPASDGYAPPSGPGPGMPSAGGYTPPSGPGPGMPGGPSSPSLSGSPDGLRRGVGPGMPPRDGMGEMPGGGVGPGMPLRRGVGPGMPSRVDSGSNPVVSSSISRPDASRSIEGSSGLGAVEYDDDDEPKRRPLLIAGIGLAVIAGGAGLGWLIVGGDDGPEGDLAKVQRTEKNQEVDDTPEAEPERPEPEQPEPETIEVKPKPKPKPKAELTFEQSLNQLKGRIRGKCKKLGPGPVNVDTFVAKDGGKALNPKVKPKGPIGDCALRLVERWSFPASEQDHPINTKVSW